MVRRTPSRIYVLWVYTKRIYFWRKNSSPFISGDAFADLADFVYKPPRFRSFRRQSRSIEKANVIFCQSHLLSEMLSRFSNVIKAKIIICGNSDFEFHDIPENLPSATKSLFLQNSFISDDVTIFSIPIGIENLRWGVNGFPYWFLPRSTSPIRKVLFGPFGLTHPVRDEIGRTFAYPSRFFEFIPFGRISPRKYAKLVRNYEWVAAVRGNGVDTHRLWESLYRGIRPIVLQDDWSLSMVRVGFPLKLIKNWTVEEIEHIVKSDDTSSIDRKSFDPLWMPYWSSKIENMLKNS